MIRGLSWPDHTSSVCPSSIRSADIYTSAAVGGCGDLGDNIRMKNLRAIREGRGLSQSALADMAGVKQATISRIEKGVNNPSLQVAQDIAEALGVNVVELFGLPELERQLLERFREASPQRRAALLALLDPD